MDSSHIWVAIGTGLISVLGAGIGKEGIVKAWKAWLLWRSKQKDTSAQDSKEIGFLFEQHRQIADDMRKWNKEARDEERKRYAAIQEQYSRIEAEVIAQRTEITDLRVQNMKLQCRLAQAEERKIDSN